MYENLVITELPNSEIEISADIPLLQVQVHRAHVIKELNDSATIAGFRSGHIPEEILIRHVGEAPLMEKVAESALGESFQKIAADKQLDVIGRPEVTITKLAAGNPIGFKIKVGLFPKFELPDYKTFAKQTMENKKAPEEVTDAEVEETLRHFRLPPEAGKEPEPLTDETVKKIGDFKSVEDFKARLKEDLEKQKVRRAAEEWRGAIAEKIIAATVIPLPTVVVESELEKMFGQFRADIERMGMTFETYLEKIKKTEEGLRKEWRPDAEKRGKMQFILHSIAKQENLVPEESDIAREVSHLAEHHKATQQDAAARAAKGGFRDIDLERARAYVTELLTNEKVFAFLESQK
ncbi:MAG TPA: trigger factor [Candidatus Paceibacterota bacterium]